MVQNCIKYHKNNNHYEQNIGHKYKAFERQAVVWEHKLNMAQAIFDSQNDVQCRWVYLQGVFSNSADVQTKLGYMFQKFKGLKE